MLTVVTGDYCGKVFVDDELVWDIEDSLAMRPFSALFDEELLPSDCRYRLDRNMFIDGDMAGADAAKRALEDAQRREAKLRCPRRRACPLVWKACQGTQGLVKELVLDRSPGAAVYQQKKEPVRTAKKTAQLCLTTAVRRLKGELCPRGALGLGGPSRGSSGACGR